MVPRVFSVPQKLDFLILATSSRPRDGQGQPMEAGQPTLQLKTRWRQRLTALTGFVVRGQPYWHYATVAGWLHSTCGKNLMQRKWINSKLRLQV